MADGKAEQEEVEIALECEGIHTQTVMKLVGYVFSLHLGKLSFDNLASYHWWCSVPLICFPIFHKRDATSDGLHGKEQGFDDLPSKQQVYVNRLRELVSHSSPTERFLRYCEMMERMFDESDGLWMISAYNRRRCRACSRRFARIQRLKKKMTGFGKEPPPIIIIMEERMNEKCYLW